MFFGAFVFFWSLWAGMSLEGSAIAGAVAWTAWAYAWSPWWRTRALFNYRQAREGFVSTCAEREDRLSRSAEARRIAYAAERERIHADWRAIAERREASERARDLRERWRGIP